jgi:thiamine-phosphate kinase
VSNGEFDIIQRYFTNISKRLPRKDVIVSIGDDCAITELKTNQRLAVTTDTMVENTHFLPTISPADLAYKSVVSNLSDLAAMGAEPAWFSLALTLPKIDHFWLTEFSQSFFETLDYYNVDLIGGDTTKGALLTLTVTAQGILSKGKALCRHSAKVGDWIYVSGSIGDSAGGLQLLKENQSKKIESAVDFKRDFLIQRHLRPTPRVLLGLELSIAQLANAAVDISDGFVADLTHILQRSQCGAVINLDNLPLSPQLISVFGYEQAERFALSGGEDYELCFTVPDHNITKLERALTHLGVNYTCVGQVRAISPNNPKRVIFQRNNEVVELEVRAGYDHFQ